MVCALHPCVMKAPAENKADAKTASSAKNAAQAGVAQDKDKGAPESAASATAAPEGMLKPKDELTENIFGAFADDDMSQGEGEDEESGAKLPEVDNADAGAHTCCTARGRQSDANAGVLSPCLSL